MFKNYLVLAFRNLFKRKLYSFINIFGLATGVAVCLVILKYVDFQLSYDNFHEKADNIYRTLTTSYRNGEFTGTDILSGYAQGPALVADIPEVKTCIRTHPMYGGAVISNSDVPGEPLRFQEERIQIVDSTFLDVFTYRAVEGNLATALDRPDAIVLTRSAAVKYFGKNGEPLGKTLQISGGWMPGDFQVTAVIEDVPENSHFIFDFLLPIHKLLEGRQYKEDNGWGWQNFVTYIELHPNTSVKTVEEKAVAFIEKHRGEDLAMVGVKNIMKFQPIKDIHLRSNLDSDCTSCQNATMSMNTIYFFIVISIFILAIAWVNYINLSTARAMERAREVGIKKAVGAFRIQLITQFIFESVVVNLLAVILALVLAVALLPVLGGIVEKNFVFDFTDPRLWMVLAALFVFGALVSGAYPAFVLSSFKTSAVLKGSSEKAGEKFSLRKALVVFQFVSSLVLIAGTFAIYRQIMFMRSQDKGFSMEQMLVVSGPTVFEREGLEERINSLKNELKKIPSVESVATSATIPGGGFNWGTTMRKVGDPVEMDKSGNVTWVDTDFLETYGMQLIAGRKWDQNIASDMESMIVNEAALTAFGLGTPQEALEKSMLLGNDTVAILGVLKNYNWNSLKIAHSPILLAPSKVSRKNFSVRLSGSSSSLQESVKKVEALYKATFPNNPFNYFFLDDFFNRQYKDDQQFAKIFGMFAVLAIIIACLGLWGLASFTTTQKLKEISIRKVLGASTTSIMSLLSAQFLKLVLIASVIAFPLMWFGIDSWLDNFAFRIGIEWDLFVVPAFALGVIALCTVSLQIMKGANSDPAKVLRSE
jgi:putative ABC transport system permease protein